MTIIKYKQIQSYSELIMSRQIPSLNLKKKKKQNARKSTDITVIEIIL